MQKHIRYVTHADGRRCTNMKFYAAVVNTYGKVVTGKIKKLDMSLLMGNGQRNQKDGLGQMDIGKKLILINGSIYMHKINNNYKNYIT